MRYGMKAIGNKTSSTHNNIDDQEQVRDAPWEVTMSTFPGHVAGAYTLPR